MKIPKQLKKDQPRFEKNINTLVKKGKNKKIKEEIFHKVVKEGDRRRQAILQKLDNEQEVLYWAEVLQMPTRGTHSIKREQDKKIKEAIWWFILIFISIPILYIIIINLFSI